MFLNRLRNSVSFINKAVVSNVLETRFSQIPNSALLDVRKFEMLWKQQKDSDKLFKHIHQCFSKNEGSISYITNILRLACDRCGCSSELVHNILSAYNQYTGDSSVQHLLNINQKTEILSHVLNFKNYKLLEAACEAFKINAEEKSEFKDFINNLLQDQKLAQAAYCIGLFKLQEEFPVEKIVLLLLNESNFSAARSILMTSPALQLQMAKLLDNLLDSHVNSVNTSVNVRRIYKSLNEIVRQFNVPLVECKNLLFFKRKGALHVLVKRREQHSVSETTFEEMVWDIVKHDKKLIKVLLQKLLYRGDRETASRLIEKWQISDFDLDSVTVTYNKRVDEIDEEDNEQLEFKLSPSDIKFVDTKEAYIDCISDIAQNYSMIGIDSEWKPHFGLSQNRLALIQLAVHDRVYILDIIALKDSLDTRDWDKLTDDVFSNPEIIKLGCGIMTDIQMIVENNSGTKGKALRFSHILDMAVFYQKLTSVYPQEMLLVDDSGTDQNKLKGLSQLCKIILGKPLSKAERLCDWEKRPLTESQLEYAALDALCLLQMYDELKRISLEKDINFDHLSKVSIVMTTSLWRSKKKPKVIKQRSAPNEQHGQKYTSIDQLKVAIHPELEIHSKQLKNMGANVLVLQHSDKASDVVLICKTEDRILICMEDLRKKVHNISPDVLCFSITSDTENHLHKLFKKYNLQSRYDNCLVQCEVCNNKEALKLSSEEFKWLKHQESKHSCDSSDIIITPRTSFQKTIYSMKKSGVKLNLENLNAVHSNMMFLCIKCGHVQ